jgi:small subunit ribosomal protein S9
MATVKDLTLSIGKRKTAVARVRVRPGAGQILVNRRTMDEYFPSDVLRLTVKEPLRIVEKEGSFNIVALIRGGGPVGQAGALRHGIARALVKLDETLRAPLKKAGLLTRDPRRKERKKYGQKGARKRFQFSKR